MEERIKKLEQELSILKQRRIYQLDISPLAVKQRHIDGLIIFKGDSSDRPSDGSTEKQVYFSEDTSELAIWNRENNAWEGTTLS